MEKSGISNATIVALIAGLVLGFAGGAYWYKGKMAKVDTKATIVTPKSTTTVSIPSTTKTTVKEVSSTPIVTSDASIIVSNQSAGATVMVAKVISDTEVWVAVREDKAGTIGNILGAKKVAAGTNENVIVQLLRGTVAGGKYYVVMFKDNGDGAFDSKKDTLVESNGKMIVSTFNAQ